MYLSRKRYEKKLRKIKALNASYKRKMALAKEKQYGFKLPSMSKIVLMAVLFLCLEIVIFCEYVMVESGDTSALYALIGVPTTLVPVVISYYKKSAQENTVGGIVYETAILEKENSEEAMG